MAKVTHILNKSLTTSSYYNSLWTVNFNPTHNHYSPLSKFSNKNINKYNTKNNNKNVTRFASFFTAPLFTSTYSNNNICTCCYCFYFPSFSLRSLCRYCSSTTRVCVMSSDGSHPSSQDSSKTVRCVIKGRVQGVFYRNWTVENATQLGLRGWVRNKRDGSVEALFSGKPESVDEMMQRCRRGPPDAMVTAFQANPCNDDPGTAFERRPTV